MALVLLFGTRLSAQTQPAFSPALLNNPAAHSATLDKFFSITSLDRFHHQPQENSRLLANAYASANISNAEDWPPPGKSRIRSVNIIFSAYPAKRERWITNYHHLLAARLKALFELDPALNDATIEWKLTLQTDCPTEEAAKQLFHGIEVAYEPVSDITHRTRVQRIQPGPSTSKPELTSTHTQAQDELITAIEEFMDKHGGLEDSTVHQALDRWDAPGNTVLVADWTGSMYPYSANAVLWHIMNPGKSTIQRYTFFNDGNSKKKHEKQPGRTGGIYHRDANDLETVVRLFNRVIRNGKGGDSPENDLEAVFKAATRHENTEQILLVADNRSCIRDFAMLDQVEVPVNIILCGADRFLNAQYLNLAWKTGGKVFTLETGEWQGLKTVEDGRVVRVANEQFAVNANGWLESSSPQDVPVLSDCEKYYREHRPEKPRRYKPVKRPKPRIRYKRK